MAYLIFAFVMAATIIGYLSLRVRYNSDPSRTVDTFQRAIKALSPEREDKGHGN
ncbi:MAG: hypothetical protein ACT4OM_07895 [Actinomycetota bacterium]